MAKDQNRALLTRLKLPDGSFQLQASAGTPTGGKDFVASAALTPTEVATLDSLLDKLTDFVDAGRPTFVGIQKPGGGPISVEVQIPGHDVVNLVASDLPAPVRTAGQDFLTGVLAVARARLGI